MKYDVTFFAPFMASGAYIASVGAEARGGLAVLTLSRGPMFQEWRDSGMMTTEGSVGDLNRASMHALLDAWLDGVEFDG